MVKAGEDVIGSKCQGSGSHKGIEMEGQEESRRKKEWGTQDVRMGEDEGVTVSVSRADLTEKFAHVAVSGQPSAFALWALRVRRRS